MPNIELKEYLEFKTDEIIKLYKSVGWMKYVSKPTMLKNSFNNSLYVIGAYLDGELVGILRAVGDGNSIVYVQDLIISPNARNHGLATKMLVNVINKFEDALQLLIVTSDNENAAKFYQSIGFEKIDKLKLSAYTIVE